MCCRAIASPRPVPPRRRPAKPCRNGSKIRAHASASIPTPVSATSKRNRRDSWPARSSAAPSSRDSRKVTEPASVNFTALPSRLISTCRSLRSSPTTRATARRPRLRRAGPGPSARTCWRNMAARSRSSPFRSKATAAASARPASIFDRSSTSSISPSRWLPLLRIVATAPRAGPAAGAASRSQDLRVAEDRVHRRADLVAHVRQERALGPVGGGGLFLGTLPLGDLRLQRLVGPRQLAPSARGTARFQLVAVAAAAALGLLALRDVDDRAFVIQHLAALVRDGPGVLARSR